jgi:hypothetical protein
MLYTYVQIFDVTENLENFLELNVALIHKELLSCRSCAVVLSPARLHAAEEPASAPLPARTWLLACC